MILAFQYNQMGIARQGLAIRRCIVAMAVVLLHLALKLPTFANLQVSASSLRPPTFNISQIPSKPTTGRHRQLQNSISKSLYISVYRASALAHIAMGLATSRQVAHATSCVVPTSL